MPGNKLRISKQVLIQKVGDEAVLLDLSSESYFGLDPVGFRIWQLIESTHDLQQVHSSMLAEFDVDPEELSRDIEHLVEQLIEAGLVEPEE